MAEENGGVKITKERSPNYPVIALPKAVERAKELYAKYKRSVVPIHLAHEQWGYKAHSGVGNQCVAALNSYGLLDVDGVGTKRTVRLTDAGYQIVADGPARAELLKKAAVAPPIHKELWEKYRGESPFPDDQLVRHYLRWEREDGKFNENSVDTFIGNFRGSLEYARLVGSDMLDTSTALEHPKIPNGRQWSGSEEIKVGTLVQWTSGDVDQFPDPRPVLGFYDPEHAFFSEGGTGVPVRELTPMEPKKGANPQTPTAPQVSKGTASGADLSLLVEDRFNLDEGPVIIRWPSNLSAESVQDFEYQINGLIARRRRKAGLSKKDGE